MIARDRSLRNLRRQRYTPFFINGRQLVGAQPFASFKTVIDEEIKKAEGLLKGTPKAKIRKLIENGKPRLLLR